MFDTADHGPEAAPLALVSRTKHPASCNAEFIAWLGWFWWLISIDVALPEVIPVAVIIIFFFFLNSMFISVEDRTGRIRFSYNYSMIFTCSQ